MELELVTGCISFREVILNTVLASRPAVVQHATVMLSLSYPNDADCHI
jgi:hypothetical protein